MMRASSPPGNPLQILRKEVRGGVNYSVYKDQATCEAQSELNSLCGKAFEKYKCYYEAFKKEDKSDFPSHAESFADSLEAIAQFYFLVIESDSYARYTVNTSGDGKPFILYLRDFSIGSQEVTTFSKDHNETRTRLSIEWGEHAFLPALREELEHLDVVGVLNPAYLTSNGRLPINFRKSFYPSSGSTSKQKDHEVELKAAAELQGNMFRFQNNNWEKGVASLIRSAHAIIMYLSDFSNGSTDEISMIKKLGRAPDTLIFYGHKVAANIERSDKYLLQPDELKGFADFLHVKKVCSSEVQDGGHLKFTFLETAQTAIKNLISSSKGSIAIGEKEKNTLFNQLVFVRDRPQNSERHQSGNGYVVLIPSSEADHFDAYLDMVDRIQHIFDNFKSKSRNELSETIASALVLAGPVFVHAAAYEDRVTMMKSIQCLLVATEYTDLPKNVSLILESAYHRLLKAFQYPGPKSKS